MSKALALVLELEAGNLQNPMGDQRWENAI